MIILKRISVSKIFNTKLIRYTFLSIFLSTNVSFSQQPAFPGAEGWGKYASGGRNGEVYEVTNLNDTGPGSLRDAVSQPGRIVVFRVSGNIELKSELRISGNITIAGQTAPGDGICVRDYPSTITGDNIIIRYMRFRLGDRYGLKSDAFSWRDRENVIIDHCTFSWGGDECFSAYQNNNITLQYCIVGEGLDYLGHSMGGLWGSRTSYHHNLIHTNVTRHPKYAYLDADKVADSRNNVIYNWGSQSAYTGTAGKVNLVNNYYKPGPATSSAIKNRFLQGEPGCQVYATGNYMYGNQAVTDSNWLGIDPLNGGKPQAMDTPLPVLYPIPEQSAEEAYIEVLQHAGASFPKRDDADNRAIRNVIDGTGFILDRQSDAGGFPRLYSIEAPADFDHDGMPDDYETGLGLDPNDYSDRNGDLNGDGYTNIENYINELISYELKYARPGFFNSKVISENAITLSWYDLNEDESGFIIERSTDSIAFTPIDTTSPDVNSYADNSLSPLSTYYYRIKSYCDTAESEYNYSLAVTTFATGALPGKAVMIRPENNQADLPVTGTTLEWEPGEYTLTFNVYTGDSEATLELKESEITKTSYKTGFLDFDNTVFWRIDAINANGTTTGDVWQFTTISAAVPQLIGYWPFNEADGEYVYDSTDYDNHGTMKNIPALLRTEGSFGGAIDFSNSATTGHIEIPHQPELSLDDEPFSISLWIRLESIGNESTYILHKGAHNTEGGDERNGKWIGLEMRDGIFRFAVDDNSKKTECASSTPSFVKGEWVHVAIIRDAYKKKIWMYKNSILNTQVNDNTGSVACDLPLILGNSDFMDTPYFGEIDELVICKHPLTLGEIDSLYRFNKIPTLEYIPSAINTPVVQATNFQVFPNPFSNQVTIEFDNGAQNRILIEIYSATGQFIRRLNEAVIPNTKNKIIWDGLTSNNSMAGKGYYLLVVKNKDGVIAGGKSIIKTE